MARLPTVGGDDNTWGGVLNDFLGVEHDANGNLKIRTDGTLSSFASDAAVVHKTGAETIAGVKTFSSSPVIPTPASGTDAANKTYIDTVAAGYLPLTGGTLTGNLLIRDSATPTKQYRFRTSGGALDFEAAGTKLFYSVWENADFTGTQRNYIVMENAAQVLQLVKDVQFRLTADGTQRHRINADTGGNVEFNSNQEATDFTVKGDTDANALVVDGSADAVGIGVAAPQAKLHVAGVAGGVAIKSSMPDAAASTSLVVMNQANAVTPASGEPVQFWFGAVDSGLKTFWLNEGGNPRSEAYASDQVPLKLFARRNGGPQTANLLEIFDEDSVLTTRVGASGNIFAPNLATDLTIGTWTALTGTYVNGYAAYTGSTYYTPQYRVLFGDVVELRGRIEVDGSAGAPEDILTGLPTAARPARNVYVSALQSAGAVTSIEIDTAGAVINQRSLSISWISLDGVTYYKGAN